MKIAVITDDEQTVSQHFGRAQYYTVLTIENGQIAGRQTFARVNHQHQNNDEPQHEGSHHNHDHASMIDPIADCQVILVRGMGMGAYNALIARGIQPVITDIPEIDQAVKAYLAGNIVDHPERLH
jgi:predicted Fe-Mo cluster-binding NifX family protein